MVYLGVRALLALLLLPKTLPKSPVLAGVAAGPTTAAAVAASIFFCSLASVFLSSCACLVACSACFACNFNSFLDILGEPGRDEVRFAWAFSSFKYAFSSFFDNAGDAAMEAVASGGGACTRPVSAAVAGTMVAAATAARPRSGASGAAKRPGTGGAFSLCGMA